ncbi:MAG: TetR/AcrR family transcriptional regulator [Polaromonas sp.]|nr:TetR/AcrR family transcriptional regulator [Polaromonas sp.]
MNSKSDKNFNSRRMTRTESQQQTRERLRAAALLEFSRRGVAGTSAERIAEAAGLSKGAFYANFRNKEALLLDLMRRDAAAEAPEWVQLADEGSDIEDILRGMHRRAQQYDPEGKFALIAMEVHLAACRDLELAQEYATFQHELHTVTRLFLQRMFEKAGKQSSLPLDTLANVLMSLRMSSMLPQPQVTSGSPVLDAADVLSLVLHCFLDAGIPAENRSSECAKAVPGGIGLD